MPVIPAEIGWRKRQLATSWNELTSHQLLQVAQAHGRQFASEAHQREALLLILLQVPARVFRQLNGVQRIELRRYARFLHQPTEYAPLTAQLLPRLPYLKWYQGLGARLYGPRENFRNLRFAEFIFADSYFLRYLQTNDEAQLDALVATLYRRTRLGYDPEAVDYQGDRREDFNEYQVARWAKQVAQLPHHVKYAVLLWYRGCRQALERRYEYVFTEENKGQAVQTGWLDVLHSLAGEVHLLDATAQQPLHAVLREMNRLLRLQAERPTNS